jgi:hypothetical protein
MSTHAGASRAPASFGLPDRVRERMQDIASQLAVVSEYLCGPERGKRFMPSTKEKFFESATDPDRYGAGGEPPDAGRPAPDLRRRRAGRRGGRSRGRQKPRTADRGRPAQTPSNATLGARPRPSGERLGPEPTESPFGGGSGSSGEKLGMVARTPATGAADPVGAARRTPAAGRADPVARRGGPRRRGGPGAGRRHHRDLPGSRRSLRAHD